MNDYGAKCRTRIRKWQTGGDGRSMVDTVIHYAENNVFQCWCCANKCGEKEVEKTYRTCRFYVEEEMKVLLPLCRCADMYMTEVYQLPCRYFKQLQGRNELGGC